MFRLFLVIFYIAAWSLGNSYAKDAVPQSFEDIAADLKAKKAAMEPFDQNKVKKIDIESFGLDPLEDKSKDVPKVEAPKVVERPKSTMLKTIENDVRGLAEDIKDSEVREVKGNIEKIKEVETAVDKEAKAITTDVKDLFSKSTKNSKTKSYVASPSKKKLKDRLNQERNRPKTKNEKAQDEKTQELNNLKKKYLLQVSESGETPISDDDDLEESNFESDDKIIPVRKEIGKFDSHEPFPPPIISNFRAADNVHIPLVPSRGELIKFLFDAIAAQDISIVNAAFKDVGDANVRNVQGDTALTYAIIMRKYPVIESILTKGADPNMPNKLGYTPFALAIELSDSKSLSILLKNQVDLNYVDAYKRNYLIQASRIGFLPAMEALVRSGIDLDAIDSDGFGAIATAQRNKQDVAVKYLVKSGARLWVEKPYDPESQSIMNELRDRWK